MVTVSEPGSGGPCLHRLIEAQAERTPLLGIGSDDWPRIRQVVIEVDLDANLEPITTMPEQRGHAVIVDQDSASRIRDAFRISDALSWLARDDAPTGSIADREEEVEV